MNLFGGGGKNNRPNDGSGNGFPSRPQGSGFAGAGSGGGAFSDIFSSHTSPAPQPSRSPRPPPSDHKNAPYGGYRDSGQNASGYGGAGGGRSGGGMETRNQLMDGPGQRGQGPPPGARRGGDTPSYGSEKNRGRSSMGRSGGSAVLVAQAWNTLPHVNASHYQMHDRVGVSNLDFVPSGGNSVVYLKVKNGSNLEAPVIVVNAEPLNCESGKIYAIKSQRTWYQMSPGNNLTCEVYEPREQPNGYVIGTLHAEVWFTSSKFYSKRQFKEEELVNHMRKYFLGNMMTPGQPMSVDIAGCDLTITIKAIELINFAVDNKKNDTAASSDINTRGVFDENTVVRLTKSGSIEFIGSVDSQATNPIIAPDFKFESLGIGGLDAEFSVIFRRAFASRIFPPGLVAKLGLPHVKGMLLYGPPGTGKTLIARQIGKMLNAREPKVINGPEVLNKFVGQSEENIRKMFSDAEKEYKEKGDSSGLHIIIFDELDAVCKQRGSTGGGTGVGDSVVNQLLSKLDGVDQLNNILLIGMTNRKDMIDDALLRPGRLEVQIEIGLPDEHGRSQILGIHTERLRVNKILGRDVNIPQLAALTKNFSGAEIAGLVRSASSFAMNRHVKVDSFAQLKDDVQEIQVTNADFFRALDEVKPAFGAPEDEISDAKPMGVIHYSSTIESIITRASKYWNTTPPSATEPGKVSNILLHGAPKSGTTAMAAHLASLSTYPYVKMVTLGKLSNMRDEYAKADYIAKVFADSYKSPLSVVILDEIDLIFEYVPLGPRFSNHLLSVLKGKMKETPPKGHRLLILSTTCNFGIMDMIDLRRSFSATIEVPVVSGLEELQTILMEANAFPGRSDVKDALSALQLMGHQQIGLGIKALLEEAFIARGSERQSAGMDFADSVGNHINERLLTR
ncbi:transport between ER and Golgi ATPase protein [Zalerion maritima]|uniref:Vesicular-fusion protein SEC18 n=1 Tax=Zalerion maritima TaxID=339359 RepID=A0AAD5RN91_9PEZI|nr:transport between ER and Golgi ATPase protein [Zalerion maritima]